MENLPEYVSILFHFLVHLTLTHKVKYIYQHCSQVVITRWGKLDHNHSYVVMESPRAGTAESEEDSVEISSMYTNIQRDRLSRWNQVLFSGASDRTKGNPIQLQTFGDYVGSKTVHTLIIFVEFILSIHTWNSIWDQIDYSFCDVLPTVIFSLIQSLPSLK